MTSFIEQGLADFVKVFLQANEINASVHNGTSNEPIPPDASVVILSVKECQHVVGPLYNGLLDVIVSTPAVTQKTVSDHRVLVAEMEEAFDPDNAPEINAAVQTAASCSINGWFYQGPKDTQQGERWHTVMSYVLGVARLT